MSKQTHKRQASVKQVETDHEPEATVVPQPGCPTPHADLPHALTFFLTAGQRRAVLRALAPYKQCRAVALLRALKIDANDHE